MSNLGKTNAQWERLAGRELCGAFLAPMREFRELYDKLTRERTQIVPLNLNGNITALTLAGVNYGVNTSIGGELWVRFAANGGNWDANFYTAAGASGLVAHVTNIADGATASLVADNSSGLSGSVTLGAAVVAVSDDLYKLLVVVDYPGRLPLIFPGTEGIEDDKYSREVASQGYSEAAAACLTAINALKAAAAKWGTGATFGNVRWAGRGNSFNQVAEGSLSTDSQVTDQTSGNVTRRRGGLFVRMSENMRDETTGSEQDVVRRVVAAGAGSFDGANSGRGTVASHTPSEKTPVGVWTFECDAGSDTGALGRESFSGNFRATDGSGLTFSFSGLRVERDWSGPRGLGSIRLRRTYAKTGDGSNLNLAAVTTGLVTGETNQNTENGVLYWRVTANGSNWDYEFFSASSRIPSKLVAKATNVATGGAINATPYNSGVSVTWTAGSGPVNGTEGTLTLQPFLTQNSDGKPDKFTITTSITGTPGLIQSILADEFDAALNSDSSGSETIEDAWAMSGTFAPRLTLDN